MSTSSHNPRSRRFVALSGAVALALTLAACGANSSTSTDTGASSSSTSAGSSSNSSSGSSSSKDTSQEASQEGIDAATVEKAVSTAQQAVSGGRAYELDVEHNGTIEVQVAAGDRDHDLTLSADGSTVDKQKDESLDSSDRSEVDAAKVSLTEAVTTALKEHDGTVSSVSLDEDKGTVLWEVDVHPSSGHEVEVYVDAASGQIVQK